MTEVAVVALSALVIIANETLAGTAIEQAVFQEMSTPRDRGWHLQNRHFNNGPVRIIHPVVEDPRGLDMVSYAIDFLWCPEP